MALESNDLSDGQARALLKSPAPLADVFKDWEKRETGHVEDIWETMENRANAVLRQDFIRSKREER